MYTVHVNTKYYSSEIIDLKLKKIINYRAIIVHLYNIV